MADKILAIIFSLLILLQAWGVRCYIGTWLFPACLFGLLWFLATIVPLLIAPMVPVEPLAVAYLLVCCFVYSCTAIVFDWKIAFQINRNRRKRINYGSNFLRLVFYVTNAVSLIGLIGNWGIQGLALGDLIFNLAETSNQYLMKRYSDELIVNIFGQAAIVLTYVGTIVGGYIYGARRQGENGIGIFIIAMLPSILVMLVEAAKGTLFLALSLFWSGVLTCKLNKGDLRIFGKKELVRILLYAVIIVPCVIFAFVVRGITSSGEIFHGLVRYAVSYSSGHLFAFSDWFSYLIGSRSVMEYNDEFGTGGFYTFMAIFKFFGSEKITPPGTYDEYFYFQDIVQTNIYTMFRGLIIDYYLFGSIIFVMVLGVVSHLLFWRQLVYRSSFVSVSFFCHLIGFFYSSVFVSLLMWNSVYASFIIIAVVLFLNNRPVWRHSNSSEL